MIEEVVKELRDAISLENDRPISLLLFSGSYFTIGTRSASLSAQSVMTPRVAMSPERPEFGTVRVTR